MVHTMGGHTGPVNSISQTADGRILTGSWDGTVKIWQNGSAVGKLDKNQMYATEVLGLPSGEIVTGSGNKAINIYRADGSLLKSIPNAHERMGAVDALGILLPALPSLCSPLLCSRAQMWCESWRTTRPVSCRRATTATSNCGPLRARRCSICPLTPTAI